MHKRLPNHRNRFTRAAIPDPPFHAFFPKRRGLAEKAQFLCFFALFCAFLAQKDPIFPCFRILYPRLFRQNCPFLSPQMPLALRKSEGRNDTKKAKETKKAQKGGSGMGTNPGCKFRISAYLTCQGRQTEKSVQRLENTRAGCKSACLPGMQNIM